MIPELRFGGRMAGLFPADKVSQAGDVERSLEERVNYAPQRFVIACTSSTRPTNPRVGDSIMETNTGRELIWNGTAWIRASNFTTAGRTGLIMRRNAAQSIGSGATATITWDVEDTDTDGFIAVPATTVTIPAAAAGIYIMNATVTASGGMSGGGTCSIIVNGVATFPVYATAGNAVIKNTFMHEFSGGGTISVTVYNGHSGSLNFTGTFRMWRVGA